MYEEIIENLEKQLSTSDLNELKSKTFYLTYMLNGNKTIESRFSKNKIIPYNKITKDDIVIIKKSSGDVLGYFTIKDVLFFDLNTTSIEELKLKYNSQLCVDEIFWNRKKDTKYATLIMIDRLIKLKPFHICKKGMQTWIKF